MADERLRRAGIVDYWRAVELFSPQKIPAVSARDRVYPVTVDGPLPWEAGHPLRSVPLEPGYAWQHVVYGGAYALRSVRDTLLNVFGESEEDHDGRMDGESALFALTITDEGRLLLDSPVLSTCAWATGRALSRGPGSRGWLDGVEEEAGAWAARATGLGERPASSRTAQTGVGERRDGRIGPDSDGEPPEDEPEDRDDDADAEDENNDRRSRVGDRLLSAKELLDFARQLSEAWGVAKTLRPDGVRVRSVAVRQDLAREADQQDFLNSFIAADLDRVARALREKDPGAGLAAYLTPAPR
ncbi:hypothetical protein [Streptomyces vastus]